MASQRTTRAKSSGLIGGSTTIDERIASKDQRGEISQDEIESQTEEDIDVAIKQAERKLAVREKQLQLAKLISEANEMELEIGS
ncbi:hypothetical protein E2P81_ATG12010 [Venturia nashicola]|nr:hypothetical protein E2P81_ATG12010 [Venturia nashicola]